MCRHVQLLNWHCMSLYHLWETFNKIWLQIYEKCEKKETSDTFMKINIAKKKLNFLRQ